MARMARWRGLARRRGVLALSCALVAALALAACARVRVQREARAHVARAAPHALAHALADFSLQPHVGSWRVVEDGGNHTTWRYAVAYECGTRCAGVAQVEARAEWRGAAPTHTHAEARRHHVAARLRTCTHLPLLHWLSFCDEMDTVAVVEGDGGGGARLHTSWARACAAPRVLSGACAAALVAHRDALLLRVRAALGSPINVHPIT